MKKIVKVLSIVLAIIFVPLIYFYFRDMTYPKVIDAVSIEDAMDLVSEKDDYYIISMEGGGGFHLVCRNGKYKDKNVEIRGKMNPQTCLSNTFLWPSNNRLLIKATKVTDDYYDDGVYSREVIVECEDFKFIKPIIRDYTYAEHWGRMFSPTSYIDSYDVMHEDYVLPDSE